MRAKAGEAGEAPLRGCHGRLSYIISAQICHTKKTLSFHGFLNNVALLCVRGVQNIFSTSDDAN